MASPKSIFLELLDEPAAEREQKLVSACAGDSSLEKRVRALLSAHARADSILGDAPSSVVIALPPEELRPGVRVGDYQLIEQLGEGGFGSVWRAEQTAPVRRNVALKVLKVGMSSPEVVARFQAERQALALMDHPSIARVYDAGATDSGRPFFAMELVEGIPITAYVERRNMRVRQRLELFLEVCRAVQHAHQKGVIHRDIKPNNVLVTEFDGRAVPKVIDFGIAKAVEKRLTGDTELTRAGQMVGTPAYMSPEQIVESKDIDTRSDIYALGVLLYELLCGTTPFGNTQLREMNLVEVLRIIREVDPPKPSSRLRAHETEDTTSVHARQVRGDLDWIVMCCLAKDRDRRYESAALLANDVRLHLAGEPVLAGPPNLSYRVSKFVHRYRTGLAVTIVMFALLFGGMVAANEQARRARTAESAAEIEAQDAKLQAARFESLAMFLEDILLGLDPAIAQGADNELLTLILDRATERVGADTGSVPEVEATARRTIGAAYLLIAQQAKAEVQLQRALQLDLAHLGSDDLATIQAHDDLGALYVRTADYDKAEMHLSAALTKRRELQGEDHIATLKTLGNYAILRRYQGHLEEAEAILLAVQDARTEMLGPEHPDTIETVNNLAGVYDHMGAYEEALELYGRAFELQREKHGDRHPLTLKAANNYAGSLQDIGRNEEAEALLRYALRAKREILEEGDRSLIVTLCNLAALLGRAGDDEEALELLHEALDTSRAHLGVQDPIVRAVLFQLGRSYMRRNQHQKALLHLEEAARASEGRNDSPELSSSIALALRDVRSLVGTQ